MSSTAPMTMNTTPTMRAMRSEPSGTSASSFSYAAVDLTMLPDITITIDCDVLQGDGGTRTASVTEVALEDHPDTQGL